MDVVDMVSYRWEGTPETNDPEEVRRAFCDLFDAENEKARLVMRHLVRHCKWMDQTEYSDPIVEAKYNSLHGVIREIKKQLNIPKIELGEIDE